MKDIFWYSLSQIFRKKTISVLTTMVLAISFILIQYAGMKYLGYRYSEWKAKEVIKYDFSDIYNINLSRYAFSGAREIKNLSIFYKEFENIDGVVGYGSFIEEYDDMTGITYLYISGELLKLCGINNAFTDDENVALVGNKLTDKYPLESEVFDYLLSGDMEYKVEAVMNEGSRFISSQYIDVSGRLIDLDYAIVFDLDKFLDGNEGLIMQSMVNDFYFIVDDNANKDEIMESINSLADMLDIKLYGINSMKALFRENAVYAAESIGETYLMPIVMMICALISLVIATLISIRISRHNMGIMMANGFTRREGTLIYILENIIKITFAYLVSLAYWSVNFYEFGDEKELLDISLKVNVIMAIVIILISSIVPIIYINNKKPCELIDKKYD